MSTKARHQAELVRVEYELARWQRGSHLVAVDYTELRGAIAHLLLKFSPMEIYNVITHAKEYTLRTILFM